MLDITSVTTEVITKHIDLTGHWVGFVALGIFVLAYILVMSEESHKMRKSKPVVVAAGLIWAIIALTYKSNGVDHAVEHAVRHNLLEFSELMLFLLVAMTYVAVLEERQVFNALRSWLIIKKFTLRRLFWITGFLAFWISPIADNLTTALLMCAVILAVGGTNPKFVSLGCINVVVAANAGGAFSPFGDITTLMVWQKGHVGFFTFFGLMVPAMVNWLIPAAFMGRKVPNEEPEGSSEIVHMERGAKRVMALFGVTIVLAVSFHQVLELPPVMGMLMGFGLLQFFGYYLKKTGEKSMKTGKSWDIFDKISRAEWDTLFFFYGVVLSVGGLGFIGYLGMVSEAIYLGDGILGTGTTGANVLVGILSAIVDNIPVMFAVLSMHPDMSQGQWMLVALTAGTGGSLLSIGSAAGVALMGKSKGMYTFMGHLKWTPVIALGYAGSIWIHFMVNTIYFAAPAATAVGAH